MQKATENTLRPIARSMERILLSDDCFEHSLHPVHRSTDHWPHAGMLI